MVQEEISPEFTRSKLNEIYGAQNVTFGTKVDLIYRLYVQFQTGILILKRTALTFSTKLFDEDIISNPNQQNVV
ncbi:MAG: hypothetical protein R2779_06740 [Crocinitomicaceae bacterium]